MPAFIMNKPPGCITARVDFEDRPTVYDHVPKHFEPLPHVGRLDFNTEGLLLFTDDGKLAQALLNKDYAGPTSMAGDASDLSPIEKVYHVKVKAKLGPDDPVLAALQEPLEYEPGKFTAPARTGWVAERSSCTWIEIAITEGRHRQVRRLCDRSGLQIRKLRRVRLGPLELGELKLRWCRHLSDEELTGLYVAAFGHDPRPWPES